MSNGIEKVDVVELDKREQELNVREKELALTEKELGIKQKKLEIEHKEIEINKHKSSFEKITTWVFNLSPIAASVIVALVGLYGGILGSFYQANLNIELERQKFETTLILKAVESQDNNVKAKNLEFFVKTGLLKDKDDKITNFTKEPEKLPYIPPEDRKTVEPASKELFNHLIGIYYKENSQKSKELADKIKDDMETKSVSASTRLYPTKQEFFQKMHAPVENAVIYDPAEEKIARELLDILEAENPELKFTVKTAEGRNTPSFLAIFVERENK